MLKTTIRWRNRSAEDYQEVSEKSRLQKQYKSMKIGGWGESRWHGNAGNGGGFGAARIAPAAPAPRPAEAPQSRRPASAHKDNTRRPAVAAERYFPCHTHPRAPPEPASPLKTTRSGGCGALPPPPELQPAVEERAVRQRLLGGGRRFLVPLRSPGPLGVPQPNQSSRVESRWPRLG